MTNEEILKELENVRKIQRLMLPSYRAKLKYGEPEVIKSTRVYEIHTTFGGGMGGGSSYKHLKNITEESKYIIGEDYFTNSKIRIYKNNIVSETKGTIQVFKFFDEYNDEIYCRDAAEYFIEDGAKIEWYDYRGNGQDYLKYIEIGN